MKQVFWKSDWFVGLLITLVFLVFMQLDFGFNFIQSIERDAYDVGVRNSTKIPSDKIAIIAIDDQSIANLGRWPWPRDIHARMYEILAEGGAKVIGQTALFSEPQIDPGLQFIRELKQAFEESSIANVPEQVDELNLVVENSRQLVKNKRDKNGRAAINKISEFLENSPLQVQVGEELTAYMEYIASAEAALDTDKKLAESMQLANNIVQSMQFDVGDPLGRPDEDLPEYVQRNKIPDQNIIDGPSTNPDGWSPLPIISSLPPIPELGGNASSIGALITILDIDGSLRSEPLVVNYYGNYYPSVALVLAANSLNLGPDDIKITMSSDVQLGRLKIKTDEESLMQTFFYNGDEYGDAFPIDSFYDVIQGKIPPSKYKDKIVLIGATAYGVGTTFVTPIDAAMTPVETLAHSVSSILNEDFFIQPEWANSA